MGKRLAKASGISPSQGGSVAKLLTSLLFDLNLPFEPDTVPSVLTMLLKALKLLTRSYNLGFFLEGFPIATHIKRNVIEIPCVQSANQWLKGKEARGSRVFK